MSLPSDFISGRGGGGGGGRFCHDEFFLAQPYADFTRGEGWIMIMNENGATVVYRPDSFDTSKRASWLLCFCFSWETTLKNNRASVRRLVKKL